MNHTSILKLPEVGGQGHGSHLLCRAAPALAAILEAGFQFGDPVGDTREDRSHTSSWLVSPRFPLQGCCLLVRRVVGTLQEPALHISCPGQVLTLGPTLQLSTSLFKEGGAKDNDLSMAEGARESRS